MTEPAIKLKMWFVERTPLNVVVNTGDQFGLKLSSWDLGNDIVGVAARGRNIEAAVTAEYKAAGWYALDEGTGAANFDLVDFQRGSDLVSLKTVNTAGKTWMGRIQGHIDELAAGRATVGGNPANMILDLRVQPGGAAAAQPLVQYGQANGVRVIIQEFP